MIRHKTGNVFEDASVDVVFHGCNCYHAMHSGIAREVTERFPEAQLVDDLTAYGDLKKLGSFTTTARTKPQIINLYTQHRPGPDFRIAALGECMVRLRRYLDVVDPEHKLVVAGPRIGCGIGGGEWAKVEAVINSVFIDREILIYTL